MRIHCIKQVERDGVCMRLFNDSEIVIERRWTHWPNVNLEKQTERALKNYFKIYQFEEQTGIKLLE